MNAIVIRAYIRVSIVPLVIYGFIGETEKLVLILLTELAPAYNYFSKLDFWGRAYSKAAMISFLAFSKSC